MSQVYHKELQNRRGIAQGERLIRALLPDHIKVDERQISDFLSFAASYGITLNYFDANNRINGDWGDFFANDVSVFLSTIITTDLAKIDRNRIAIVRAIEDARSLEEKMEHFQALFSLIMTVARKIDNWYVRCVAMNHTFEDEMPGIGQEIENAIEQKLGHQLRLLKSYDLGAGETNALGAPIGENYDSFHEIWQLKDVQSRNIYEKGSNKSEKIKEASKKVRLIYRSFYSVLAYIVHTAPSYLKTSLEEKSDHKPDVALFIAFIKLFTHAQEHLNSITSRHLDHYYYTILQQQQSGSISDSVHVCFNLGDQVDTYWLEKGTPLAAGTTPSGKDIQYIVQEDILLNKATIESLKTIYVSKSPLIGITSSYKLISNVYAAPVANSNDGMGAPFINNISEWPPFGEEQMDKATDERKMTNADIGFAISSPTLELREGVRTITLTLRFNKKSAATFLRLIKDISKESKTNRENAFYRVFHDALRISLTAEIGWLDIVDYDIFSPADWGNPEITIILKLDAAQPAIVKYTPEFFGLGYDTLFPLVRILLNVDASVYAYSFLKDLLLETILISVDVEDMKEFAVYNELGKLDATQPFQPFGSIPRVGSYLLIGNAELFKKELTNLTFNFEWFNLPNTAGGFEEYYQVYNENYKMGLDTECFKVRLTALSDNIFSPDDDNDDQTIYSLYETDYEASNSIASNTIFKKCQPHGTKHNYRSSRRTRPTVHQPHP